MSEVFVAVDVEATGMDPSRHEIIEVALVAFTVDAVVDVLQTLVRPRGRLSLDIATLTGISATELDAAPEWSAVAGPVRRFISGRPVVGQSPDFDLAMLTAAGVEHRGLVYDTHELAALLLPDLPAYNLATIAAALGVVASESHRALADAETTAAVFRALLGRIATYDRVTRGQLGAYAAMGGMGDLRGSGGTIPTLGPARAGVPSHGARELRPRAR